jgi:hypothetical protein
VADTKLATVIFLVVPCGEPVVSDTSVIGMMSAVFGVALSDESEDMRELAMIFKIQIEDKIRLRSARMP